MDYCPHCMAPVQPGGTKCPRCGGDLTWKGQAGIDLPVGTVLTGGNGLRSFIIGAARGKGGFGITYVAMETHSRRRVAIKEYFPTRCAFRSGNGVSVQAMTGQENAFQGGMRSFLEEARTLLAQEDLPTVVKVIDYFQANGTAYLVMEYLDGVALHNQMIKMGARIPASELLPRMQALIRDMGVLHQRGIIHRDVSPDNIMWMPDGGLKLLDFGSARSTEDGKSMTVLLKQGFSPIEQYRSRGQGSYTDVYALAATIYYCVTGVIPPSAVERLEDDPLQPPNSLGAGLTPGQEEALLWGLTVQPKGRPQTMEAFAARLYAPEPAPIRPPQPPVVPTIGPAPKPQPHTKATQGEVTPPPAPGGVGQKAGSLIGRLSNRLKGTRGAGETGQKTGSLIGKLTNGLKGTRGAGGAGQPADGPKGTRGAGGSNKKPLIIAAAAVIILIILFVVVFVVGIQGLGASPGPSYDPSPSFSSTPSPSASPTSPAITIVPPSNTPTVPSDDGPETGVTEGGFTYALYDGEYAVLTGFEGDGDAGYMPDDIDGVPITAIADSAFAGVPMGGSVFLPIYLETIGATAFRGCSDLEYVYAYSDVTTQPNSFQGSALQTVLLYSGVSAGGWDLPAGCRLFFTGMDTELGAVRQFIFGSSGELYGITVQDSTVLLDVPAGTGTLDLTRTPPALDGPVEWVDAQALARLSGRIDISLPDTCYFDPSLYERANWICLTGSPADMWLFTNEVAAAINQQRPAGADQIVPDLGMTMAAMDRAEELVEKYDGDRPDGSKGFTALKDHGVDYTLASQIMGKSMPREDGWFDQLLHYYTDPLSAEDSEDFAGQYYTRMGAAYYSDGSTWYDYAFFKVS